MQMYSIMAVFPRCNLTQHEDDGEERVPVEGQGTQQEHADAQQPASIHKQTPRNQAQKRHPYRAYTPSCFDSAEQFNVSVISTFQVLANN